MSGFEIGDPVPAFKLKDTAGVEHGVPLPDECSPPATVLLITCNHCPYVHAWNPRLRAVAEEYEPRGVRFLAINANDATCFPADSRTEMERFVNSKAWPIPYLHDETQSVARALEAQTTPHVFVLDRGHRLAYRGAPDGNHEDPSEDARWIREALDALLAGRRPELTETSPRGCSVKWKQTDASTR
jgi:thiol-disulfide isomerase/thioredoxin